MSKGETPGPRSGEGDDLLDRAVSALLRTTSMADGPSEETIARTLAALEVASNSPEITRSHRRRTMYAVLKLAAAVLAAGGGLFYFGGNHLAGAPVSFEEVAQKLQNAHSFAYLMTMELPGTRAPVTQRVLFKEPGLARIEPVPAGGPIIIHILGAAKRLVLDPATKSAMLLEGALPGEPKGANQDLAVSEAENFRKLAQKKGEPAGEKKIGNIQAQGFRVKEEMGYEQVIWVDPQTRSPVQVEISGKFGGGQAFRNTVSDFQLDPKLDDSLFSLEPPQGYALQKVSLAVPADEDDGKPETAVAKLLRMYAERSGGQFPRRIDDWFDYGEKLKGMKFQGPTDPNMMRLVNLVSRVQILLLESRKDYGYKPEGVKLGDADKILFWYKPKGKDTYRALFGDLHAADVTADRLPAAEKPQTKP
jgi:outer membrane lipoprotein-sorting protein